METVGTVIYGKHGGITIRQKTDNEVELGDLLVVEQNKENFSTRFARSKNKILFEQSRRLRPEP